MDRTHRINIMKSLELQIHNHTHILFFFNNFLTRYLLYQQTNGKMETIMGKLVTIQGLKIACFWSSKKNKKSFTFFAQTFFFYKLQKSSQTAQKFFVPLTWQSYILRTCGPNRLLGTNRKKNVFKFIDFPNGFIHR